jgi:hypothetical protein
MTREGAAGPVLGQREGPHARREEDRFPAVGTSTGHGLRVGDRCGRRQKRELTLLGLVEKHVQVGVPAEEGDDGRRVENPWGVASRVRLAVEAEGAVMSASTRSCSLSNSRFRRR